MLDEKWIKKVEKNIRREIKIDIDNNEFIEEIFGNYIDKNNNVLITCLDDVKSKIWPVQPWKQNKRFSNEKNNFYSVSLFSPTETGEWKRQAKYVSATCCIVLDDYTLSDYISEGNKKTQIPFNKLPLKPTWIIRTSDGNTQVGYKLSSLITDVELIDYIYNFLKEKGFSDGGANSNKLMRLPNGKNTKYQTNNLCFLVEWNPELTYDIDEIMNAFQIEKPTVKRSCSSLPSTRTLEGNIVFEPCPEKGFVFQYAMKKGLEPREIEKGKFECICPWSNNHTTGGNKAVFYVANEQYLKGAFHCFHHHCEKKTYDDFLAFLGLGEEHAYGRHVIKLRAQVEYLLFEAFSRCLKETEKVYRKSGNVVCLLENPFRTEIMTEGTFSSFLSRLAICVAETSKKEWRPRDLSSTTINRFLKCQSLPIIPELKGVVHNPLILPNGRLIYSRSYDEESGLYITRGLSLEKAKQIEKATKEDAEIALKKLIQELCFFQFCSAQDLSATLMGIFTAVERQALDTASMFLISGNDYGAGKGCLTEVIAALAAPDQTLGSLAFPRVNEEFQKTLFSVLLLSPACIYFDNVTKDIYDNPALAIAITSPSYSQRVLGRNTIRTVSTRTLILANGNKITVRKDLLRRTVYISIDKGDGSDIMYTSKTGEQEQLTDHIKKCRLRLIRYVLTIIKAYLNEGAPTISNKRFKSFPDQDKLCRQPLLWLGMKDPLMRTLKAQEEDPDKVAFASLLKELRMAFKNKRFTTFDIKKVIQENPDNRVKWDGILSQLELNTSEDESSAYLDTKRLSGYLTRQAGDHENDLYLKKLSQQQNHQAVFQVLLKSELSRNSN